MDTPTPGPFARTTRLASPPDTTWTREPGCWLAASPACPQTNFGHRLELDAPPEPGSLGDWFALWQAHHGEKGIQTAYLLFESPEPWRQIPLEQGFLEHLLLFEHQGPLPERPLPSGYTLRPLESDADFAKLLELTYQVDQLERHPDYDAYLNWYFGGCRVRIRQGQGRWWGAWLDDRLLSAGGLFWADHEARFQTIETRPGHRKQGLASAIIAAALAEWGGRGPAYICANVQSEARGLYPKLGFEVCAHAYELGRHQIGA
jgi:GNAT superfamily N-acetyltransferase